MFEKNRLSVLRGLKSCGVSITVRAGVLNVDFHFLRHASWKNKKNKKLLSTFFRLFRSDPSVVFMNIPFCLLSDYANDNIKFEGKEGLFFSKKNCISCKFLNKCSGWPSCLESTKSHYVPSPVFDGPSEVVFELSSACNQSCIFCSLNGKNKTVSYAKIIKILDDCKKMNIKAVRFTGGEPFLYKYLELLLSETKSRGFYVLLNTNARCLSHYDRTLIKRYVDNVLISLHGYNRASESYLTGRAANFAQKIRNIQLLKFSAPIVRVGTIISDIFRENKPNYEKLLVRILGIKFWELYRPMLPGINLKSFFPDARCIRDTLFYLKNIHEATGLNCMIANPVPFCILKNIRLYKDVLLGAIADDGHSRIVFDASEYFKPSYFINENIGVDVLDAWNHPFLRKIREGCYLPKECNLCNYLMKCKGGSRFWAARENQDYFSRDPLMP